MKCQRYMRSMYELKKKIATYQIAFSTFIRLINIIKEEEQ